MSVPMMPPAPARFSMMTGCPPFAQDLADLAREDVGRTCGRLRNHELDQPGWKLLRGRRGDQRRKAAEGQDVSNKPHGKKHVVLRLSFVCA